MPNAASSLNASKLQSRQTCRFICWMEWAVRRWSPAMRHYWRRGRQPRVYAGEMPDGGGISHEAFTFWLAKRLVKTDYVSLPNLLAGRELVKELLQEECEPQNWLRRCYRCWRMGKPATRCTIPSVNCISRSAAMPMSRRHKPFWS